MSKPKAMFAAALAVAVTVATLAVPAPASADDVDSIHVACTAQGNLTLEGDAFFRTLGPTREWFEFRYVLYGDMGKKSNVDIRLYENGSLVMALLSPDDRRAGRQYVVHPANPLPQTAVDNEEEVSFEAIFDKFGYDPRCLANNVLPHLP